MRLWTIQPHTVWDIVERDGVFHSDPAQSEHRDDWSEAYDWITRRLRQHAGDPPAGCVTPIWAWYQWHGEARKKPDLRWFRHWTPPEDFVRLELEVPDSDVLLSDFDLWHYCLNYWYLAQSQEADQQFEAELEGRGLSFYKQKPLPSPMYHAQIEASWERVLDLDWAVPGLSHPRSEKHIQAVFWELRREQVRRATHFRGKPRPSSKAASG